MFELCHYLTLSSHQREALRCRCDTGLKLWMHMYFPWWRYRQMSVQDGACLCLQVNSAHWWLPRLSKWGPESIEGGEGKLITDLCFSWVLERTHTPIYPRGLPPFWLWSVPLFIGALSQWSGHWIPPCLDWLYAAIFSSLMAILTITFPCWLLPLLSLFFASIPSWFSSIASLPIPPPPSLTSTFVGKCSKKSEPSIKQVIKKKYRGKLHL